MSRKNREDMNSFRIHVDERVSEIWCRLEVRMYIVGTKYLFSR